MIPQTLGSVIAALLVLLHNLSVLAQSPFTIQNVHVTQPDINWDLYEIYVSSFFTIGVGVCWEIRKADNTQLTFAFYDGNSTVELVSGPAEAGGNDVADVIAINLGPAVTCTPVGYYPSTFLPLGQYHLRVNSTVTGTGNDKSVQQLTGRGPTFEVTSSKSFGCDAGRSFTKVPSSASPGFTSLFLQAPYGGQTFNYDPNNMLNFGWSFRNELNALGKGISNLTIEVINAADGSGLGVVKDIDPGFPSSSFAKAFKFSEFGIKSSGLYKLQLKYRNLFDDGAVPAHEVVTHRSDAFSIFDSGSDCSGLQHSAGSGSSNSTTSTPNSGSSLGGVFREVWGLLPVFIIFSLGL